MYLVDPAHYHWPVERMRKKQREVPGATTAVVVVVGCLGCWLAAVVVAAFGGT